MEGRYLDLMFLNYFFLGAFGYFEVTHDITQYCKAKVFEHIGKRTPIAIRFSTVGKALKLLYIFLHVYHSYTDSYVCFVEPLMYLR